MALINLVDGEKGGIGKSFVVSVLAQYLLTKEIPFYLVASDRSNPTSTNRYKGKERYEQFWQNSVRFVVFSESERREDAPDDLFEFATEKMVVVDLPAQAFRPVSQWITRKNIFAVAKEHDVSFCNWFVCDGEDDSINAFIRSINFYKTEMPHVLVRNWGRCDDWEYFNEHTELQKLIRQYEVRVIDFPRLSDGKRIKINANRWTFDEALESSDFSKILAKQDILTFLKKSYSAIESVGVVSNEYG